MESLYESLLDNFDTLNSNIDREMVKKFLKDNYDGKYTISKTPNKDGLYEVSSKSDIIVKDKNIQSLTNNLFIWKKIGGYFNCRYCESLKSLKGAPEEVYNYFDCSYCKSLTSLKGAPKMVGGDCNCDSCESLTSLEGAPKEVRGVFDCAACKNKFTKADVTTISNVKGAIYV